MFNNEKRIMKIFKKWKSSIPPFFSRKNHREETPHNPTSSNHNRYLSSHTHTSNSQPTITTTTQPPTTIKTFKTTTNADSDKRRKLFYRVGATLCRTAHYATVRHYAIRPRRPGKPSYRRAGFNYRLGYTCDTRVGVVGRRRGGLARGSGRFGLGAAAFPGLSFWGNWKIWRVKCEFWLVFASFLKWVFVFFFVIDFFF